MSGVKEKIDARLKEGPVHITLVDPDKQGPKEAARIAREAERGGTHLFLIGGTTGVDNEKLGSTIRSIKNGTDTPLVIFPTTHAVLSRWADAVFYISLMNSNNVDFVVREAAKASLKLCEMELEVLPVGYLVFAPGMTVGRVGDVDLIERDDMQTAMGYAKSAELFGMSYCYMEGGSGVEEPIPYDMISAVGSILDIPIIIGGGIRDPDTASGLVNAGADMIVTGNMMEQSGDLAKAVREMILKMEEGWRSRR
ncbi:MAG: geranylgeranylglyceryl/heptaprenylglyceryl phosphate synthase [Thermoplasmatota archaeon]